jgi:3-isopropylmalate/(R)-2-methylmalate dehydratase small subunit
MTTPIAAVIDRVSGRLLPVRGDDMDTDRIMPARFLRTVTFEGIDAHLFEDERAAARASGGMHPVDDPRYAGARVMVVGRNFGCGSSREHAPQGIRRAGIQAIVGESFSEIFFGNAVAIGLPTVSARPADVAALLDLAEREPGTTLDLDLRASRARAGPLSFAIELPAAARDAFLSGAWDATGLLLADVDQVRHVAAALPYVRGF